VDDAPVRPIVLEPGDGERMALGESSILYKASGEDAAGRIAFSEATFAPGYPGPLPHVHRRMTDIFYVLEGAVRFLLGDEERDLGPGAFVLVPPGVVHTFSNPHDAPARLLNIFSPAGLEGYVREVAAGGITDPREMARIAARYDFEPAP
jgi:mannose-6-phosphate isomerase-like protein (cupin superfamily)